MKLRKYPPAVACAANLSTTKRANRVERPSELIVNVDGGDSGEYTWASGADGQGLVVRVCLCE
jgi:hypothetical protein